MIKSVTIPLVEIAELLGMREPAGREFRGARLDGSYPNTVIVVNYLDLNTGNVRRRGFQCGGGMGTPHPQGEL